MLFTSLLEKKQNTWPAIGQLRHIGQLKSVQNLGDHQLKPANQLRLIF